MTRDHSPISSFRRNEIQLIREILAGWPIIQVIAITVRNGVSVEKIGQAIILAARLEILLDEALRRVDVRKAGRFKVGYNKRRVRNELQTVRRHPQGCCFETES